MTDRDGGPAGGAEGGLAEPEELQPEEGSLRLVGDDDTYDVADWEAATAAVLRKARRLGEDAPDSDVWAALTRTTLDGIDVAPIGQQSDLEGLTTSGRPVRAGAWDVRTQVEVVDAKAANEAALQDLENGATSLLLHLDGHAVPTGAPSWPVCCSTWRPSPSTGPRPSRSRRSPASSRVSTARCTRGRTSPSTSRPSRCCRPRAGRRRLGS